MVIGDISRLSAGRFGDKVAFADENREITFKQVEKRSNALAYSLLSMGLQQGDKVAVLAYNCAEYNELLFAVPGAGLVMLPLNYRLSGTELNYIINDSGAKVLIFGEEFTGTIEAIRSGLASVTHYIVIGKTRAGAVGYEEMLHGAPSSQLNLKITEPDVAYILYTSGTTGHPKGVLLTHKNIITNVVNHALELQPKKNDVLFNVPPLYHCAGESIMMAYFLFGCTSLTQKRFDAELVLRELIEKKPNILHLVPAMQNMVMNLPDVGKYDLNFLDLMIYGGSSMMVSQLKKAMETFKCQFMQFAGQTEAAPLLTVLRPEDHVVEGPESILKRLASAGREVKLTNVKIVDDDGNELPPNSAGEQIARGDNIMKGYWNLPEATTETVVDGWLHTGDICIKDEDGYVYYVDRIKDMIVRGGENVYPREIEEVIASHPAVMEVAVIGVADDRVGEEVMAVVVPKPDAALTEGEIVAICEKNLARYKKPRYVEFLGSLPKNPSGKILKRELRETYKNMPLREKPSR